MTDLNSTDVQNIRNNLISAPEDGTYRTEYMGSSIDFNIDRKDSTVELIIRGNWFTASDIKELRKFLKIIEAEIK